MTRVLDACCGARMFWFDKENPDVTFVDERRESHVLCDGRSLEVNPDLIADFTKLPFGNETFYLVVFDPPHMKTLGGTSWMFKKYGKLWSDWRDEIRDGFSECFRVLKPNGTLVFKWCSIEIPLQDVIDLSPKPPLFGHTVGRQAKTHWMCFLK